MRELLDMMFHLPAVRTVCSKKRRASSLHNVLLCILGATAVLSSSNLAWAADTAWDNATQSTYGDGWQSGDNGGFGFGAWNLVTGALSPAFIGDSSTNAGGASGNINTSGKAWGLGSSAFWSSARRSFNSPLSVGQTFKLDFDNGYIQSGSGGNVAMEMLDEAGNYLMEFKAIGGNTNYTLLDGAGTRNTGIPVTGNGLNLSFRLTGSNAYTLTVGTKGGGTSTLNGTTQGTAANGVRGVRLMNASAGDGSDYSAYFNNMSIASNSPKLHSLSIGLNDPEISGSNQWLAGGRSALRVSNAFARLRNSAGATFRSLNVEGGDFNRQAILDEISAAESRVSSGDTFLFYINSHASYFLTGDEPRVDAQVPANPFIPESRQFTTGDEYFHVSQSGSATRLTDDDFSAAFRTQRWESVNKLFFIDSCFAGGFASAPTASDLGDLSSLSRTGIIAASSEEFTSKAIYRNEPDGAVGQLGKALISVLNNLRPDESLTFNELYDRINLAGKEYDGENGWVQEDVPGFEVATSWVPFSYVSTDFTSDSIVAVPEPSLPLPVIALWLLSQSRRPLRRPVHVI